MAVGWEQTHEDPGTHWLFWSTFCCCEKDHDQKGMGEERDCLAYTNHGWSLREGKAGTEVRQELKWRLCRNANQCS